MIQVGSRCTTWRIYMIKRICVFTGNRAEYGLQVPILKEIKDREGLDYYLVVAGAHLDDSFGKSLQEIERDGFDIYKLISINNDKDNLISTVQAIGNGILKLSEVFAELKPDIVIVYADRFEGFAAAIAATQMNIPVAHIEGGDITEGGALDDSVRHSISKLSHLHFTTNQQATNRLLAMGEESWRVHTIGIPSLETLSDISVATPDEIKSQLGLDLDKEMIVFTQHSVTTEFDEAVDQIIPSIEALKYWANKGVQVVCTYPNNDAGGKEIIKKLHSELDSFDNVQIVPSLGRYLYHGLLKLNKLGYKLACIGNSSSGIKETPAFKCPAVNIGSRQNGRLSAHNTIHVGYNKEEIIAAIEQCLFSPEFSDACSKVKDPYDFGNAAKTLVDVLSTTEVNKVLIQKQMTLKGEVENGWFR